ncbi:dendrite extension defective protein 1-like [Oculina patagonica]
MVAPFWADVDTRNGGDVFYRETTDPNLLQQATDDLKNNFFLDHTFKATWLFIATWYEVPFYGASGEYTSKRNNFQAVLITNGSHSFAIFNYNKITWTTGTADSGNKTGLGGTPAQAGFNAGDGRRYFSIPGSRTREVINLPSKSNVWKPGRWMFRIDKSEIEKRGSINHDFYPFGQGQGDQRLPANDDESSGTLPISIPFPFFDHKHNSLFVNTNGVISFLVQVSQYTPDAFPLDDNRRLVAPFWADVDTNYGGDVYYRETTDTNLLQKATDDITANFFEHHTFKATWLYITTWYEVAFHGASGEYASKTNNFQAVLITNGSHSFAIFNYNKITWTTGTASSGDNTGLGGIPAQAGFNAGDGGRYFSIPGSRTHQIINLPSQSNVGKPGQWMFRIDKSNIENRGSIHHDFYPFGQSQGDQRLPPNDDGGSGTIPISIPFPFFDQKHNSLFVNTNGVISFLAQVTQYTPAAFPLSGDNRKMVAPFWADVNTGNGGDVFYRQTTDLKLLQKATDDVKANFLDHHNFKATWLFIATWYEVAFHGASGEYTSKRNNFQAVLITDGSHSFVIFNYIKITWTTGTASSGNNTGLGGTPAQAGFNAGDGRRYFSIPGSRTNQVINLPSQSNVGKPGQWMFRIDKT